MWLTHAFSSAALLGFYDAPKKQSLTGNAVLAVLLLSVASPNDAQVKRECHFMAASVFPNLRACYCRSTAIFLVDPTGRC